MASIKPHPKGGYRVRVKVRGKTTSKVLPSKRAAEIWARETENAICQHNTARDDHRQTFDDALVRYLKERTPNKRGQRWERNTIGRFQQFDLAPMAVADITAGVMEVWKNGRLAGHPGACIRDGEGISSGSVRREMNLLSAIFTACVDWQWIPENPMIHVKRPPDNPSRDRIPEEYEVQCILRAGGYDRFPSTVGSRAVGLFLFCCLTAMRAGEARRITPDMIDWENNVVSLPGAITKNGTARSVPCRPKAMVILRNCEGTFNLSNEQRDAHFRKAVKRAGITGLTFHDSRHAGITHLAAHLDVLALSNAVGHQNLDELQTYYNKKPRDIAAELRSLDPGVS